MSSRNVYLSPIQRAQATALYRSLGLARKMVHAGSRSAAEVEREMRKTIQAASEAEIDYACIVEPNTLQPVREIQSDVLAAVAVRFGRTRLIDNILIEQK